MINIYVDKDVIIYDFQHNKYVIDALCALGKLSSNVKVHILNPQKEDLTPVKECLTFAELDWTFDDLCKNIKKITKDETLISFDNEKLYKWDSLRGKHILMSMHPYFKEYELGYNKVYIKSSVQEILLKLRMHIHI